MRAAALTIVLLAGSAVAASSCVEQPAGSGCIYTVGLEGRLVINRGASCKETLIEQTEAIELHEAPRRDEPFPLDPTTTTVAPPAQTAPVTDPPAEPVGSVLETRPPTTVSTTTTPPPVAPLVASLSCLTGPLGILFAGTGNPGDHVSITMSDPAEWYGAQPSTPALVAADGSWQFTITAGAPSWFPVTVRLAQTSGATAVISLGAC